MKFLKMVLASALLGGLLAVSVNAQGSSSLADYNVKIKGANAIVEREVIEVAAKTDDLLARTYAGMLKSKAAGIALTPIELVELAYCGLAENEKAEIWAGMDGGEYEVKYRAGGIITISEMNAAEE